MKNCFVFLMILLFSVNTAKAQSQIKVNTSIINGSGTPLILYADTAVGTGIMGSPVGGDPSKRPVKVVEGIEGAMKIQQVPNTNTIAVQTYYDQIYIIDLSGKQAPLIFQGVTAGYNRPFYMPSMKSIYLSGQFGKLLEYDVSITTRRLSFPEESLLPNYQGFPIAFALSKDNNKLFSIAIVNMNEQQFIRVTMSYLDKNGRVMGEAVNLATEADASDLAVDAQNNVYIGLSANPDEGITSRLLKVYQTGKTKIIFSGDDETFINYNNAVMAVQPDGRKIFIGQKLINAVGGGIREITLDASDKVSDDRYAVVTPGLPISICYFIPAVK